jgi:hypothetical protein
LFALDFGLKDILKKSFRLVFSKVKDYYGAYVVSLLAFALYYIVYSLLLYLLSLVLIVDLMRYNIFFMLIGVLLLYLVHAYNRIYFYLIVKRTK